MKATRPVRGVNDVATTVPLTAVPVTSQLRDAY